MNIDILLPVGSISHDGLQVINPATLDTVACVASVSNEAIGAYVEKATHAFSLWSQRPAKQRAQQMMAWHAAVIAKRDDLARLMTLESGKPLRESFAEVDYGASYIEWFAEQGKRMDGSIVPSHAPSKQILVLKQPVGVCAAITPWNFPLAMITRKVAAALGAGCSIIVKPAEATPLTALALMQLALQAGLPEGLIQILPTTDPVALGKALCEHPDIRKLSFTGSTAVGSILLAQCAPTVKKVSMELGGNAPFIVFDDADIDAAVDGALIAKFRNAGQTCVCVNRFLIAESIAERFIEAFTDRVRSMKVGDGMEDSTDIGPLISETACLRVDALVQEAVNAGATLRCGGAPLARPGHFYAPTVLTEVDASMRIWQEEIFGPVAIFTTFSGEQEAIALANETPYGLAAYLYSRDLGRVWRVMQALEYGMVGVNEGIISTELAPFGGIKQSGLGREGSQYGLDDYCELKYCLLGGLGQ